MPRKQQKPKSPNKRESKARPSTKQMDLLRDYVRSEGTRYLNDPNINSIGVGYKVKNGKRTDQLSVQFTVDRKMDEPELESVGTVSIPETVKWKGVEIPTDVIARKFHASYRLLRPERKSERKQRLDTLVPGISVSHPSGRAGTLGSSCTTNKRDSLAC